jgi:hypothetical protein
LQIVGALAAVVVAFIATTAILNYWEASSTPTTDVASPTAQQVANPPAKEISEAAPKPSGSEQGAATLSNPVCRQLAAYFSDPKVVAGAMPLNVDGVREWDRQDKTELCAQATANLRAANLIPAN